MRLSTLLGKTLRHPPSDAHLASHQLLVRAGYIRTLEAGRLAYLPLGLRTIQRVLSLLQEELAPLAIQELQAPTPSEAGDWLALVQLVDREVDSYRQLPLLLSQVSSPSVPEPSARAGLFGADQRPVAEIHAFGGDDLSGLSADVLSGLGRVLETAGLPVIWADAGAGAREALFLHASGDEELVRCPACDYAAARSWATTTWPDPAGETELPPEEIATPGCDTIATLAGFLNIPAAKTLKMVFYSVTGRVTCIVIRGDRLVDEAKLARVLGTSWYYISLEEELEAIGAVGGYASPIGLDPRRVRVVADPSVRSGANFVSGANRPGYHIQNVNVPRDFVPGEWADLALVDAGDPCPHCGGRLEVEAAFSLAQAMPPAPSKPSAEYLDTSGRSQPLWMASWRLDLARLMAAVVEEHHDDYGIVWPTACAPFDVHLVALDIRQGAVAAQAEFLYDRIQGAGLAVLFDDRDASAGVKFNDADLIGVPLRLTVSKRSAKEGLIEAKWRHSQDRLKLDDEGLAAELACLSGQAHL